MLTSNFLGTEVSAVVEKVYKLIHIPCPLHRFFFSPFPFSFLSILVTHPPIFLKSDIWQR